MTTSRIILTLALAFSGPVALAAAQTAPAKAALPTVPTTRVICIGHLAPGVSRGAIMGPLQTEVRDTVKLYLAGKLDQWYSRKDENGVIFILNVTTVEEARTLLEAMPLGKGKLLLFDYIPVGPLMPLALLANTPVPEGTAAK